MASTFYAARLRSSTVILKDQACRRTATRVRAACWKRRHRPSQVL